MKPGAPALAVAVALVALVGLAHGIKCKQYCLGRGAVDVEGEASARVCDAAKHGTATPVEVQCPEGAKCIRVSGKNGDNARGRCSTPNVAECTLLKMNTNNDVSACGECATDLCNSAPSLRAHAVAVLVALISLHLLAGLN